MKKVMIGLLIIAVVVGGVFTYLIQTPSQPDKYDEPGFIGASDLQKLFAIQVGVTREEMSEFLINEDIAYMSGYISKDTIRQVKKLIKEYPEVTTIHMVDVGGSVDDVSNLEASRLVREAGLNTFVARDGHIASGGTDFFCAGVKRTAEEGAKIGVHSWASGKVSNAALLPKNDPEHKKYIDYYREMAMPDPEGFYFFTINAAEADGMHYMTYDEMLVYGLIEE